MFPYFKQLNWTAKIGQFGLSNPENAVRTYLTLLWHLYSSTDLVEMGMGVDHDKFHMFICFHTLNSCSLGDSPTWTLTTRRSKAEIQKQLVLSRSCISSCVHSLSTSCLQTNGWVWIGLFGSLADSRWVLTPELWTFWLSEEKTAGVNEAQTCLSGWPCAVSFLLRHLSIHFWEHISSAPAQSNIR